MLAYRVKKFALNKDGKSARAIMVTLPWVSILRDQYEPIDLPRRPIPRRRLKRRLGQPSGNRP